MKRKSDLIKQPDLRQELEISNRLIEMIRDVDFAASGYLYSYETWHSTLRKIIGIANSIGCLLFVRKPKKKLFNDPIVVFSDDNPIAAEEFIQFFRMNDFALQDGEIKAKKFSNLSICLKQGIKTIHKFTYYGFLACDIYLFYDENIQDIHFRQLSNKFCGHAIRAIENTIRTEIRDLVGDKRLQREEKDEEETFNYLFKAKKMAIFMFVDIRNFTPLTTILREHGGKRPFPEVEYPTIEAFMSDYYSRISKDILVCGRVDKFIGDGIMAVFGDMKDPENGPGSWSKEVVNAVCTALRVKDTFELMRKEWGSNWLKYHERHMAEEIAPKLGIGIHFGEAVFDFFGPPEHKEFSALGDAVTIAQRIESIAGKEERSEILISQPIFHRLKDAMKMCGNPIVDILEMERYTVDIKGKGAGYPLWGIRKNGDIGQECRNFIFGKQKYECQCCVSAQ